MKKVLMLILAAVFIFECNWMAVPSAMAADNPVTTPAAGDISHAVSPPPDANGVTPPTVAVTTEEFRLEPWAPDYVPPTENKNTVQIIPPASTEIGVSPISKLVNGLDNTKLIHIDTPAKLEPEPIPTEASGNPVHTYGASSETALDHVLVPPALPDASTDNSAPANDTALSVSDLVETETLIPEEQPVDPDAALPSNSDTSAPIVIDPVHNDPQLIPEQLSEPDTSVVSEPAEPAQAPTNDPYLVLVNKNNPLPEDYVPDNLARISGSKYFMQADAATAVEELMTGARNDGIKGLFIASAYRSYESQSKLFDAKVLKYRKYYGADAEEKASMIVARPGTSEHQTGLAVDITTGDLVQSFGKTPAGKWLADNAHKYGFVIRYPENTTSITGIEYEPWHLRYVGIEAAAEIYASGLVLEQFLN